MTTRLIRCESGHIYDSSAHDACPDCGAAAPLRQTPDVDREIVQPGTGEAAREADPRPPWWRLPRWWKIAAGAAAALVIVAFWLRPQPDGPATVATVEEEVAGSGIERWQTVIDIGGRRFVCVNTISPDGRYRLGDDCPAPFAGETGRQFNNPDGTWRIEADNGRRDSGTAVPLGDNRVQVTGQLGSAIWERID